jgi:hypothetical protein
MRLSVICAATVSQPGERATPLPFTLHARCNNLPGIWERHVTNSLAIVLGGIIITALILDQVLNAGTATLFLARKTLSLIAYVSFWR